MSVIAFNSAGAMVEVVENGQQTEITSEKPKFIKVNATHVRIIPYHIEPVALSDIQFDGETPSDYDDFLEKLAAVFPKANAGNGGPGETPSLDDVLNAGNDAGGLQIKNVADPVDDQDAVTLSLLFTALTSFGSTPGLGTVLSQSNDGSSNQIKNIADPIDDQDAVTKKYYNDNLPSPGGGGGGSYNVAWAARVDISGDDDTGTVGDMTSPFATIQAALNALDAAKTGAEGEFHPFLIIDSVPIDADNGGSSGPLLLTFAGNELTISCSNPSLYPFSKITFAGQVNLTLVNTSISTVETNGELVLILLNSLILSGIKTNGSAIRCKGANGYWHPGGFIYGDIDTRNGGDTVRGKVEMFYVTIIESTIYGNDVELLRCMNINPVIDTPYNEAPFIDSKGNLKAVWSSINGCSDTTINVSLADSYNGGALANIGTTSQTYYWFGQPA